MINNDFNEKLQTTELSIKNYQKKDWYVFLLNILEGEYDFDIRKTGSSTTFIKNQVNTTTKPEKHERLVTEAMVDIYRHTTFTFESAISKPYTYEELLKWGTHFLGNELLCIQKIIGLFKSSFFFDLYNLNNKEKEKATSLIFLTSNALLKIIKSKKSELDFQNIDLLEQLPQFEDLSNFWKDWFLDEHSSEHNLHGFLGLIYLKKWNSLEQEKKEYFFKKLNTNNDFKKKVFNDIIADMSICPEYLKVDYVFFSDDCFKYSQDELFPFIRARAKQWTKPAIPQPKEMSTNIATINSTNSNAILIISKHFPQRPGLS